MTSGKFTSSPVDYASAEVVTPVTIEECADAVRRAAEDRVLVVPRGAGTKLTLPAGASHLPVRLLSSERLTGEPDVRAGDSLVTAPAGLRVSVLLDRLAQAHQMLRIDPPFADRATVGGMVASNAYGLLRCQRGPVADAVVALRCVAGTGDILACGARVVKNTAGYDLCRLLTGSRGALAVIVEATFRTEPLPATTFRTAACSTSLESVICAAWELAEQVPEMDYVAAAGGIPRPGTFSVLVGASGSSAHTDRLRRSSVRLLAERSLTEAPSKEALELTESSRRLLHGDAYAVAVRVSAPRAMAADLLRRVALTATAWVWLAPVGIMTFCADMECAHSLQKLVTEAVSDAGTLVQVRWLRTAGLDLQRAAFASRSMDRLLGRIKAAFDPNHVLWDGAMECVL